MDNAHRAASLYFRLIARFDTDAHQDHWYAKWEDIQMEDDETVADYATRFNKVLKGVDYNNNFTVKMRVWKFINSLTDRLAELTQVQNPATLDAAIEAVTSAEMASTRRNGRRGNVHIIETIDALRN